MDNPLHRELYRYGHDSILPGSYIPDVLLVYNITNAT